MGGGGILVAWCSSIWSVSNSSSWLFSTSIKIQAKEGGDEWWLTAVYDPANDADKPAFLEDLHDLRLFVLGLGCWQETST
jgi:hypothetical protein